MHTLRNRRHLVILALAFAAVALAGAWLPLAAAAAGFDTASAGVSQESLPGNGGNGNGGNGNGNGGNGNKPQPGSGLSVALQPNVWNTNFSRSAGTVSAVIRGENLGKIDLASIVLVGTDAAEGPVAALRASRQGKQIRAFFAMDDAIASLDTPKRGEIHEVAIEFTMGEDDAEVSLTGSVRIVGPAGGGTGGTGGDGEVDLDLAIQADHWNVNWARSNGTVTAFIRGDGLADIDLTTIELVGTDPEAEPLPALRARRVGNHVRAFFAKDDALATLDTPRPGEVHEITIRLTAGGEETELTDRIRVVGPNR
jgi:hypothetical protein